MRITLVVWVGKDYAEQGTYQRDSLYNLSHGATVMQVVRFYYLLDTPINWSIRN